MLAYRTRWILIVLALLIAVLGVLLASGSTSDKEMSQPVVLLGIAIAITASAVPLSAPIRGNPPAAGPGYSPSTGTGHPQPGPQGYFHRGGHRVRNRSRTRPSANHPGDRRPSLAIIAIIVRRLWTGAARLIPVASLSEWKETSMNPLCVPAHPVRSPYSP